MEIGKELGLFSLKSEEPFAERIRKITAEQRAAHQISLLSASIASC
jgi:hypothetical protein